ncbi:MAG: serine/threonine protein kinase [Bacteroidales bacterium]|nr:serine/threonine protein kinase [Bacteroidales bacterium]
MNLKEGTELQGGKYRIIRVLGQGGFGITYLAEHTMLDKSVAIKEFFPKEYCDRDENTSHLTIGTKNSIEIVDMLKAKFIKEAKNISKLNHPNIITIHDIFRENETAYYVMEYVEGQALSQLIKDQGALSEEEAVGYIVKVADAICYMHSLNMNHLDIKPANIMLRSADNTPILIDFGLSKQYDASGGQTSTTPIGISHGYAPIEQYRPGGVSTFSPQTDVYALGATLYALLSGSTPPHYSDILENGLPLLPISDKTFAAIEAAMETKRFKRPQSIGAFLSLLDAEAEPTVIVPPAPIVPEETKDTDEPRPIQEPESNQADNTLVILSEPDNNEFKHNSDSYESQQDVEFVDLGLNVLWATRKSGIAMPIFKVRYIFNLDDGYPVIPEDFISHDHKLPSIVDFENLIQKCSWTVCTNRNGKYYKVVGPNGNHIEIPFEEASKILTRQSLEPNLGGCAYFMYINKFNYSLGVGVPDKALIWEIKEKNK